MSVQVRGQGSSQSQAMRRDRTLQGSGCRPPYVSEWNKESILALLEATRFTDAEMARRAKVDPKTVQRWRRTGCTPHRSVQRELDRVLGEVTQNELVRFCALTGLAPIQEEDPDAPWQDYRSELARLTEALEKFVAASGVLGPVS